MSAKVVCFRDHRRLTCLRSWLRSHVASELLALRLRFAMLALSPSSLLPFHMRRQVLLSPSCRLSLVSGSLPRGLTMVLSPLRPMTWLLRHRPRDNTLLVGYAR